LVGSVRRGSTLTGGALTVDSVGLGLSVGLGGRAAIGGGVVSAGAAGDGVAVAVVSTGFAGPPEPRDISRTIDTTIAMPEIPIAPIATIAVVVRYQSKGGCRRCRSIR
jgi:hypothetical protein